ncbi:MAG: hypothetical protein JST92_04600 [Deltaproteobacteria bacterium]|nr:hypothetical protein [Deltaproteobacteria bacterium]
MNLTLTVDEAAVEKARQAAQREGTSLQALLRAYIERLAGEPGADTLTDSVQALWKRADAAPRKPEANAHSREGREAIHDERFEASKLGRRR